MLDGHINKTVDLRKVHYLIKMLADLSFPHAEYGTAKENILPAREFLVKACSNFQERANTAEDVY